MRTLDLRHLSKRLANAAADFRARASRQHLVQVTSDRLRSMIGSRPWPTARQKRETALELYVAQAQIATGHAVGDHIANVVQKRLARLTQTKNFESAKEPIEALHDLRVASRRLRAFIDVFEPLLDPDMARRAKRPLRKITRAVRTLRDWDVQMGLLRERLERCTTEIEQVALEDLLAAAAVRRKQEAKFAHRRLRGVNFDELCFALFATLGATVTHLPPPGSATVQFIWELIEPFTRAASADRLPDDSMGQADWLHQLRISLKKLRYALELFEPAFGPAFGELYSPIESLQELLGRHQDLVVLSELMERHCHELELENRATLARALVALKEQLFDERQALVVRFRNEGFDPELWRQTLRSQLVVGTV